MPDEMGSIHIYYRGEIQVQRRLMERSTKQRRSVNHRHKRLKQGREVRDMWMPTEASTTCFLGLRKNKTIKYLKEKQMLLEGLIILGVLKGCKASDRDWTNEIRGQSTGSSHLFY